MGRCLRFRCHFEEGKAVGSLGSAECWVLREERELAVGSGQLAVWGVLGAEC